MLIQVNGLTKLYKNGRGARDITFDIAPGEVLGLLGPNGSGKTTVMKVCIGLTKPSSGTVHIDGHNVFESPEAALSVVGALIEAPALFERLTARKNLELAAAYYPGLPASRIDEVLELTGILRYQNDRVQSFSLGMRQRTGLALALLSNPKVLILDEPANGMDIEGMVDIREIIKRMADDGAAVMVSSHLAHEIEQCATKVGIMHDGNLLRVAGMDEVFSGNPSLEDYYLAQVKGGRDLEK